MSSVLRMTLARSVMHASFGFVFLVAFTLATWAEDVKRVALVIGNSSYESVADLKNPANDARDIARTLTDIGFEVTLKLDLTQLDLLRAFQEFQRVSAGAHTAIVYYAGHGIEIDKQNYLVPVSAQLKTDRDVVFEAVPLETALLAVEGAAKVSLVIMDACRDNPFAATMVKTSATRSIGRGLALVEPQGNTLVAYAAREGTTASDGSGRNSPYAAALIKVLQEPGVEIGKMFRRVRDDVMNATSNQQEPFTYGSLSAEDLFIHPPVAKPEPAPVVTAAVTPTPEPLPTLPTPVPQNRTVDRELDALFWESVKDSGDPQAIEFYLQRFPDGVFADLARLRLMLLQRESVPAAPTNTPTQQVAVAPAAPVTTTQTAPVAAPATTTTTLAPVAPTPEAAPQIAALEPTEDSRVVVIQPDTDTTSAASPALTIVAPSGEIAPTPQTTPAAALPQPTEPFVLNRDKIRTVQRQLNALGYDTGRPDGVIGRRTRGGVSAFQASLGLPETGEIDATVDQRLNFAISEDRLTYYEDKFLRARVNRRLSNASLHGTYCHARADGTLADGMDGRPFVCTYVRPLGNQLLDVQSYYGHVRNANGNAMFPILTRARGSGDTYTEDDGTQLVIANGVMRAGTETFIKTDFPG